MIKKSRKIIASLLMVLSIVSISPTVSAFADSSLDENFLNQCTQVKSKTNTTLFEKDGKYYLRGTDNNYMPIIPRSTFNGDFYAQDDGSIVFNKWIYSYDKKTKKNVWRYFDSDGVSLKGFQTINGVNYFFSANNGNLCIGWVYASDGGWHYSYSDGSIHEGWIQDNGKWYYIYSNGVMAHSTTTPDGYHVNNRGVCTS